MKRLLSLVLLAVVLLAPARPTLPVAHMRSARPALRTAPPCPCRPDTGESSGGPARTARRGGAEPTR